jgi:hypothetical protein
MFRTIVLALLLLIGAPLMSTEPKGVVVGELQDHWKFPSDHLPIGATIDGLRIASWNVLNALFIDWIERNGQGLSRSEIMQDNVLVNEEGLTLRDQKAIDKILEMLRKGRDLIALQECGQPFVKELKSRLPKDYSIQLRSSPFAMDQEAIVYDTRLLTVDLTQAAAGIYTGHPRRLLMDVVFKRLDTGKTIRIINAHVPGEPQGPAHYEFARYVIACEGPCIAMGDFNFDEFEMREAFGLIGTLLSPYCTNIEPYTFRSRCLDHFYLSPNLNAAVDPPENVLSGLGAMVDLLLHGAELHSIN